MQYCNEGDFGFRLLMYKHLVPPSCPFCLIPFLLLPRFLCRVFISSILLLPSLSRVISAHLPIDCLWILCSQLGFQGYIQVNKIYQCLLGTRIKLTFWLTPTYTYCILMVSSLKALSGANVARVTTVTLFSGV